MRRLSGIAIAVAVAAAGAGVAVAVAMPAQAGTQLCEKWGATTVNNGKYIVSNNIWGATTRQCIEVTENGFKVTEAEHNNSTNGGPAAYPSIYSGCHYSNCTSGSPFPATLTSLGNVSSSASITVPDNGTWNSSYDIWLDPTARTDGQNTGAEIMIWINRKGPAQPAGSKVGTATIAGATWDVWYGNLGWNVISYYRQATTTSFNDSLNGFVDDAISRGYAQRSWYMTSVQFGFEPWVGGTGLAVNSFSVNTGGAIGPSATPSSARPSSPAATPSSARPSSPAATPSSARPSSPAPTPSSAGSCKVSYTKNEWNSGFTGSVTITNTGSSALNGWDLRFNFSHDTTKIVSAWNATVSQTGRAVTAKSMAYNGSVPAGGNVSFGFQGTHNGTSGVPSGFTVNGVTCS